MKLLQAKDPYTVYIYTCGLSAFIFTFIFTVNLLYHVQVVKLDPLQLVLVGTVLELTVFLFEIPTGLVADMLLSFAALHYIGKGSIYKQQRYIYFALFIGSVLIIGSLLGFALSTFTATAFAAMIGGSEAYTS
ncbi:hypothetical protein [Neobacillus niacini]|uniref:hypothetical protein n=1 Tax=Neobacillus niacini TaxID=86668 RepID=UPI0021CB82E6|nr:hypothetical protein [Neobacillus niacini]MCM3766692.1 hypothetical protein [Neobacillus niacini]